MGKALRNLGTLALVVTGAIAGCNKSDKPTTSPSSFTDVGGHTRNAAKMADLYHGGFIAIGDDIDYDGDGHPDQYVLANDGTIFHTNSNDVRDQLNFTRWYKLEGDKE